MNDAAAVLSVADAPYDAQAYRRDFPILGETVHGKPLVYLDSAASAQKPRQVIDAVRDVYEHGYANVHRGVHYMSERATDAYEGARTKVREFLNARHDREIIFNRNSTEAINMVAQTHGRRFLAPGDEILISVMEHHSNIVPWQLICEERGAKIVVAPINTSALTTGSSSTSTTLTNASSPSRKRMSPTSFSLPDLTFTPFLTSGTKAFLVTATTFSRGCTPPSRNLPSAPVIVRGFRMMSA